ncbi:hypothetical protein LUQ84_003039 [Hamiltosporidium tvaerminnensis]|nr:hypothetical protein LUQ84_003039 [Hamiltosporidium tvaerminnensis]
MTLNTNDTFTSKQEALTAIKEYTSQTPYLYTSQTSTPKHHTLHCKGKDDFNCDAHISISYRKKDNLYVVKRIKTIHKCPLDIHTNSTSTLQYLKQEILHLSDPRKEQRIGDIVVVLNKRNIKVGYHTVWKALNYEKYCNDKDMLEGMEGDMLEGMGVLIIVVMIIGVLVIRIVN